MTFPTRPKRSVSLADAKQRLAERLAADGVEFRKCANCGTIYPFGPDDSETVCGERCADAYLRYLNEEFLS